jgi:hypothetical protein
MHRHEIAFAKQAALATSDWDTYQTIIRTCLTDRRRSPSAGTVPITSPPGDTNDNGRRTAGQGTYVTNHRARSR